MVNNLSSLKVYSLTKSPHSLHPNNPLTLSGNENDQENDILSPSLHINATYPQQLQLPTDLNSCIEENIVMSLVQQKNQYINDIAKLTANYNRTSK